MAPTDPLDPKQVDLAEALRALGPPQICAHCGSTIEQSPSCPNCGSSEIVAKPVDMPRIPVWLWILSVLIPPLLMVLLFYRFGVVPLRTGRR